MKQNDNSENEYKLNDIRKPSHDFLNEEREKLRLELDIFARDYLKKFGTFQSETELIKVMIYTLFANTGLVEFNLQKLLLLFESSPKHVKRIWKDLTLQFSFLKADLKERGLIK